MLQIIFFVINTFAGLFAGFLLVRFWMQAQRVRPPMDLAQSIFQLTDWLVRPLRRVVPGFAGYDWASLFGAILVAFTLVSIEQLIQMVFSLSLILVLAAVRFAQWILYGFMSLLILEAIFSWVNPSAPFAPFIRALNAPILSPLRKLIPPIGSIDFSPLIALMVLQIVNSKLSEFAPVYLRF